MSRGFIACRICEEPVIETIKGSLACNQINFAYDCSRSSSDNTNTTPNMCPTGTVFNRFQTSHNLTGPGLFNDECFHNFRKGVILTNKTH